MRILYAERRTEFDPINRVLRSGVTLWPIFIFTLIVFVWYHIHYVDLIISLAIFCSMPPVQRKSSMGGNGDRNINAYRNALKTLFTKTLYSQARKTFNSYIAICILWRTC